MDTQDEIERIVLEYFDGDSDKYYAWMSTYNPSLDEKSPNEMIMRGDADKLLKIITVLSKADD